MKTRFLFLMLFIASYSFSQSVNDYKAVIIPMKYDFLREENQYRLQTITKINLQKAGFRSFYVNESIPAEFKDRCNLLSVDVKKENAFLATKLSIIFKDCYGVVIYQSAIGKSREKEWGLAYYEALNDAFKSVYDLNYKYNGNTNTGTKSAVVSESTPLVSTPAAAVVVPINKETNEPKTTENTSANLLYAQPTSYGYQLINSEPKVVMKVYKTSNPASFMAIKGSVQGVLVSKENQWFFEYYQNDQLFSEKVEVKF
ncbi:MAG: hypothetical protein PHC28_17055 [Flavobacterium sp.]|uniref:hypothetical protein n=1 Tax=Flavobacterium sp. TaxID=239 RepID=UPI002628E810|nr:hypothetical protein [Flavobacterium sp.]MDD5152159.1 hypothetical protein [Flavobacterium sp.]